MNTQNKTNSKVVATSTEAETYEVSYYTVTQAFKEVLGIILLPCSTGYEVIGIEGTKIVGGYESSSELFNMVLERYLISLQLDPHNHYSLEESTYEDEDKDEVPERLLREIREAIENNSVVNDSTEAHNMLEEYVNGLYEEVNMFNMTFTPYEILQNACNEQHYRICMDDMMSAKEWLMCDFLGEVRWINVEAINNKILYPNR